jgi:hypothetical protein
MTSTIRQPGTMLTCPNCQQPFKADLQQIYDVGQDPTAKMRFLSGSHNMTQCPHCGFQLTVAMPVAYHDPGKELLLVHVPMELNINHDEQERIVGQLMRTITDNLPQEMRKGYLFKPRRAFTLQGMIETILEADGVTKEMIEARRQKADLMGRLLETDPDHLDDFVAEHDADLDEEFFQMVTLAIETALVNGQQAEAQQIAHLRDALLEETTYGREVLETMSRQEEAIQEVSQRLQKLGNDVTHDKLLKVALEYEDDDERLQVFVGLTRPALDYAFFQLISERIDASKSKKQRNQLRAVRDRILELTEQIDQQRQAQVQQASAIVQELVNSDDLETAVAQAMPVISDLVIAVVEANIRAAEERNNTGLKQRLEQIYELIRTNMTASAPPEVQFINELLTAENQVEAQLMLTERGPEFGESLLQYMDMLIQDLAARGGAEALVGQLQELRNEAAKVVA